MYATMTFAAFLLAASLAPAASAQAASVSVFDREQARAFCEAGSPESLERCLSDQERAAFRIDHWLAAGDLPHYLARQSYAQCDARHRPDLRRTWQCIDDRQDQRRDGGGPFVRD